MEIEINETAGRGVMVTPGVFVDGVCKSTGRVPSKKEIEGWLQARSDEESEVTETNDTVTEGPCACLYYLQEQTRMTKTERSLFKFTCKGCGITFSSNVEKDYCFDCAKKKRREK